MLSKKKCKFFDKGFCKLSERGCQFYHPKETCQDWCEKSGCPKRHPKTCRYGYRCKFDRENKLCEGNENNIDNKNECLIEQLKNSVKLLELEIDGSKVTANKLKHKIDEQGIKISRIEESVKEEKVKNNDLKKAFDYKCTEVKKLNKEIDSLKVSLAKRIQNQYI